MIIEALSPLTLTSKKRGPRSLAPGEMIELPDHIGRQVLERAKGKVRLLKQDWQTAWEAIAQMTLNITDEDPRFMPVMKKLGECDRCFERHDWPAFLECVKKLIKLCHTPDR